MSRNAQSMSPIQKQAVLVCAVCALAILITASVTYVLLATKGGAPSSSSVPQVEEPDDLATHYQVDTQSAALLTETADAGEAYLNDTLFLGDSNTVRLYNNGLITLQQFCAKEGIGIQTALSEPLVTFRGTDERYTMSQAVAMMKPRRVVITLGTNDSGMEVETFIGYYTQLVQQIQASYPYTDIIVNTVPPVPEDHSNYPSTSQEKLDDFNMALLTMCENLGVKFLNSAEVLKDPATGFGLNDYYISGDIHLKNSGLKAMLSYLTTHAYETEDRRPDTDNIPTRTLEYTSNPSDPVAPSSSSEAAGDAFEARYRIDQAGLDVRNLLLTKKYVGSSPQDTDFYVLPRMVSTQRIQIPFSRIMGSVLSRKKVYDDPFEFAGLRDYSRGDPMKYINWKASAKTGDLLVNIHESTLSQKVAVVVDLEGLGVQQADVLNEEAMRIACTLCVRLLEAGVQVEAWSNGLDALTGKPMAVPEVSGAGSILALRKTFACARADNGLLPIQSFFPGEEGDVLCVLVSRSQREELARDFAQRAGKREWVQIVPYRESYQELPQMGMVQRLYWEV